MLELTTILCALILGSPLPVLTPTLQGECEETHCDQLGGSTSCAPGFNCVHSASVKCGGLIATVTYETKCNLPGGGSVTESKVQAFLKTETTSITNRCDCDLSPSLGRTWGEICCEGDCCECFDLNCF